jgi:hypothetical protein
MELVKLTDGMILYGANDKYEITENTKFLIKLGEDKVLNETVPNGKKWAITITIKIEENNI